MQPNRPLDTHFQGEAKDQGRRSRRDCVPCFLTHGGAACHVTADNRSDCPDEAERQQLFF